MAPVKKVSKVKAIDFKSGIVPGCLGNPALREEVLGSATASEAFGMGSSFCGLK